MRTEPGRLSVDGAELAYVAQGEPDGPPVLCLHGFPDVPRTFSALAERLAAEGYRVVAPWLRGYPPSTLRGPLTVDRLAADACAVADALWPDRSVRLVGHDWGAVATYGACEQAPHRFARAVTLAVPHPAAFLAGVRRHPRQLRRSWYMFFFQLPRLPELTLRTRGARLIERLWRDWSPGFEPPPDHLAEAVRCVVAGSPAPIEYYRSLWPPDLGALREPSAHRIEVPLLHLHGERDGCVGPELAEGQERWFAEGALRVETVPEAGHWLHLERPRDVSDRIVRWLKPCR